MLNQKAFSTFLIFTLLHICTALKPGQTKARTVEEEDLSLPGTIYEAEDFSDAYGCSFETQRDGYSGRGYVDYGNGGSWIEWSDVNVEMAGQYLLKFRYAVGDSKGRACELFVQGTKVTGNLPFAFTGGWQSWNYESKLAYLEQGSNAIRVRGIGAGPNLDFVYVGLANTADQSSSELYLAETYTRKRGCSLRNTHKGYSGNAYMDYGGTKSWVEWNNVNAIIAGEYLLTVRYAAGGDEGRECELFVERKKVADFEFAPSGWTTWKTESKTIFLQQGNNRIRIRSKKKGPNVDLIQIDPSSPTVVKNGTPGSLPTRVTANPSRRPSHRPSHRPTSKPSVAPSAKPTMLPSSLPSATAGFDSCHSSDQAYFEFTLFTDRFGSETSWKLVNKATDHEVASGGRYDDGLQRLYIHEECIDQGDYVFTISDSFGDGICCRYGKGSYALKVDGIVQETGGEFGNEATFEVTVKYERSPSPTLEPSLLLSSLPTTVLTSWPTNGPSETPSTSIPSSPWPTTAQTASLSVGIEPTSPPSSLFSSTPSSQSPTTIPSLPPSTTSDPSSAPSKAPTNTPSSPSPTATPSTTPSTTTVPSWTPSNNPSEAPSPFPTQRPSLSPTNGPSSQPSYPPSLSPSTTPTSKPSVSPSSTPSKSPTTRPSGSPSMSSSAVGTLRGTFGWRKQ